MDINIIFIGIIHFLHIFATVTWIGGMTTNTFVIMPALQSTLSPPEIGKVMAVVMKRFKKIVYISILILFVTGILMNFADDNYGGLMVIENNWSIILLIKHILVLILAGLAFYGFDVLAPKVAKLAAKGPSPEFESLRKKQIGLAKTAFFLGILILLSTGLLAAIK